MRKSFKYLFILPILIVLFFLLSCATDYNKYADQYYQEGLVFYERMEYDRSIDSFKKVLEVAPYGTDNDLVYYNLGMAYFKQRQYDESIYQFTKALELIPEKGNKRKFNVLEWRGNAYQQNKDFDNAIKDYSGAIHLIPTHENIKNIYHNRAWSWINKRNYDKAIEDFSSAISIDPKFDASYYGRAYVWYKKADLQRAIIDAKEAVKLNPANKKYDDLLYEIKSSKRVGDQALWGPFIEAGNKK
jgi:tetratricopeptide (TPR) repeat protein